MRVIIESPFAGATKRARERNGSYLQLAIADSLGRGEAPFASHGFYTHYLDDNDAEERALGIAAGQAWMEAAELVAVYEDIGMSPGMEAGIAAATALGIRVEFRSIYPVEPSADA